jgi:hypothetical protein
MNKTIHTISIIISKKMLTIIYLKNYLSILPYSQVYKKIEHKIIYFININFKNLSKNSKFAKLIKKYQILIFYLKLYSY